MRQFSFLSWNVYQDSQTLFSRILAVSKKVPKDYGFELRTQLIRAALSIILNIAEGSGKHSKKELARFLDIALGSAYETLACLDTLVIHRVITEHEFNELRDRISSVCKQIGELKRSIK